MLCNRSKNKKEREREKRETDEDKMIKNKPSSFDIFKNFIFSTHKKRRKNNIVIKRLLGMQSIRCHWWCNTRRSKSTFRTEDNETIVRDRLNKILRTFLLLSLYIYV